MAPNPAIPGAPGGPRHRLSLNVAAARIAAAYGFSIRFRETLEPGSGRIEVCWTLKNGDSDTSDFTLELYCQPPVFPTGHGGWSGWFQIRDGYGLEQVSKSLVAFDLELAGRKACALTRQKFCEWAENQAAKVPEAKPVACLNKLESLSEMEHA